VERLTFISGGAGWPPRIRCREMICADFLAGANLENGNPNALLLSLNRLFGLLPRPQRQQFVESVRKAS